MRYERVSLVSPPLDDGVCRCVDTGHWVPLNLLVLASYLYENGFKGEIRIFDHQIMNEEEIISGLNEFKPDLVGISPNIDTYQKTLKIAALMKTNGADIVLGGSYATELGKNILSKRDCVDYIVERDGEEALFALTNGDALPKVPNLLWRGADGTINENHLFFFPRATHGEIDYSLVDLNAYFKNYERSLHPNGYKRPVAFMTQRGCVWREKSGGCVYCSRIEHQARFDDVQDVWRRLVDLREKYGIDCVLDVGDDFLGNLDWLRAFHKTRPGHMRDLGIRFIYGRVNNITLDTIDMLSDLNIEEICLGIEAGDKRILKNAVKGNSPAQQLKAIELLEGRGINIIAAIILGLPGESRESIETTFNHTRRILEFKNINELIVSMMIPIPGSKAYEMLLNSGEDMKIKYQDSDIVEIGKMRKDWMERFCDVDIDTITHYLERIDSMSEKSYVEMMGNAE